MISSSLQSASLFLAHRTDVVTIGVNQLGYIGLLIICFSLAVLIWINWPSETDSILVTLEPTVFISP